MKYLRITGIVLAVLLLVAVGGFVIWAETPLGPMDEAVAAMEPDAQVKVTSDRWIVFEPVGVQPTTGFIFYPGARVDERSYAPSMRGLAAQGYLAIIVPMPLNLAIFNPTAATNVIAAYPQITSWAIGGHSMGGAMAVNYAHDHTDIIEGVALWAAYPQESDSLADQKGMAAVAIFGSNDGLVDPTERQKAVDFMPPGMPKVLIEGGNHAQFGFYGDQPNDNPATISHQDQGVQTVEATISMLRQVER